MSYSLLIFVEKYHILFVDSESSLEVNYGFKKLESFAHWVRQSFEQVPGLAHDSPSQVFGKTFYFHAQCNMKSRVLQMKWC